MASKGIFDNLGDFITAGGLTEAGVMLGGATGIGRVQDYVRRHVPGISDGDLDGFMGQAAQGNNAARQYNGLGPNDRPDPSLAPTVPRLFGDTRLGRRVVSAIIATMEDGVTERMVRVETEDFYTREELLDLVKQIIKKNMRDSPDRFGKVSDDDLEKIAIRELYTAKAF